MYKGILLYIYNFFGWQFSEVLAKMEKHGRKPLSLISFSCCENRVIQDTILIMKPLCLTTIRKQVEGFQDTKCIIK